MSGSLQGAPGAPQSFDVLSALAQAAKGQFQPPASPSQPVPANARVPTTDIYQANEGAQAPPAPSPQAQPGKKLDVLSALGAAAKGQFRYVPPPVQNTDESTLSGIAAAVPSGLYSAVAGLANIPSALARGYERLNNALGGEPLPLTPDIVNPNPTGYQPHGGAERAVYSASQAVGSLPTMGVEGAVAEHFFPAAGEAAEAVAPVAAQPAIRGATQAATGAARSMREMPIGPAIFPVAAGAVTGQVASDAVPAPYKPYADLAGNLLGGVGAGMGWDAAANGVSGALRRAGSAGIGPRQAIGGMRVTGFQAGAAANALRAAAGPDIGQFQDILQNAPEELVPGSRPTTAQMAPLPDIVQLEQAMRVRPGGAAQFNARAVEQNRARFNAVESVQPEGNPFAVGRMFVDQLNTLEDQGRQASAALRGAVGNQVAALGAGVSPETAGAAVSQAVEGVQAPLRATAEWNTTQAQAARNVALEGIGGGRQEASGGPTIEQQYGAEGRGQLLQQQASAAAQIARLRAAIDPTGEAGALSAPIAQKVADVYGRVSPDAKPVSGEEAAILGRISQWPRIVPLDDVFAMRQRVGDAISAEVNTAGRTNTEASRRLVQVKNAIDNGLAEIVAQQVAYEDQAVAAGEMTPEETSKARYYEFLRSSRQDWYAKNRAGIGGNAGEGSQPNAGGGYQAIRGMGGAGTAASRRVSGAPVNSTFPGRIPSGAVGTEAGAGIGAAGRPLRSLTPDELKRFGLYRQGAQDFAQTFHGGPVAEILSPGEYHTAAQVSPDITRARGGFGLADSEVMPRFWNSGKTQAEDVHAFLRAGGNGRLLTDYAADDLRRTAIKPDGTLDLKQFAKWRKAHAGALLAFPEVRQAFDGAAKAQATLEARQADQAALEAAHPLRGLTDAQVMGRYFVPGDQGAEAIQRFARDTDNSPAARKALTDYAVYKLREFGAIKDDGTLDRGAFGRFLRNYQRALSALPELRNKLGTAEAAQNTLDATEAAHVRIVREYREGIARHFLDDDPLVAVRKAFGSGNPEKTFAQLASAVRGNADAEAGLKRAVVEYIQQKLKSAAPAGTDTIDFYNSGAFRKWIDQNKRSLRQIFGGQGLNNLDMVAADLRRAAQRTAATPGSDTVQKRLNAARHGIGEKEHGASTTALTLIGEHLGERFGEHGGIVGAVAFPLIGGLVRSLRRAGIEKVNDLITEAMLHPSVARELMTRLPASGKLGVLAQKRIAARLEAVLAAELGRRNESNPP